MMDFDEETEKAVFSSGPKYKGPKITPPSEVNKKMLNSIKSKAVPTREKADPGTYSNPLKKVIKKSVEATQQ